MDFGPIGPTFVLEKELTVNPRQHSTQRNVFKTICIIVSVFLKLLHIFLVLKRFHFSIGAVKQVGMTERVCVSTGDGSTEEDTEREKQTERQRKRVRERER